MIARSLGVLVLAAAVPAVAGVMGPSLDIVRSADYFLNGGAVRARLGEQSGGRAPVIALAADGLDTGDAACTATIPAQDEGDWIELDRGYDDPRIASLYDASPVRFSPDLYWSVGTTTCNILVDRLDDHYIRVAASRGCAGVPRACGGGSFSGTYGPFAEAMVDPAPDALPKARARYAAADAGLNRLWKELRARLPVARITALQAQQRQWIAAKEAGCAGFGEPGDVPRVDCLTAYTVARTRVLKEEK
ncbi:lysozyme inhibitor LprI family protein [Edaphosphingomonas haloaromaticamans]|uniref:Lysozyme inhibitor LprI-like N-terminal domain-containing protein n=1 Tax=Edaphosphingomonas haloaromaticamans TaxID=653954 RepID=A0A1S1HB74_9SPHN|nr:lysozyme inhibitor LprI family protein [Sphingomonas haloaromaticamans]OHT18563.1 hypothetical protein BHE75_00537 [Sphingomonas haloaromaticamans]